MRTLPASIVLHANPASTHRTRSATILRCIPRIRIKLASRLKPIWCTGEDSNLRSSLERQIYSLLPLTTRPPVQTVAGASFPLPPDTIHPSEPQNYSGFNRTLSGGMTADGSRQSNLLPQEALGFWSWRRDLNPRPSDYKSDALPAELRQPGQPHTPAP